MNNNIGSDNPVNFKSTPNLTYRYIKELGLNYSINQFENMARENNLTSSRELYNILVNDSVFQNKLSKQKMENYRETTTASAKDKIDKLFGKITPTGNTIIPTAFMPEYVKNRNTQAYDGIRPQILNKAQRAEYDKILKEQNEMGTQAIEDLYNFIATGNRTPLIAYGTKTDAIPKEPRYVVRLKNFESVTSYIEDSHDLDAITDKIRVFREYNTKHNLILPERFHNQLDILLESKSAEIARYNRLVTIAT